MGACDSNRIYRQTLRLYSLLGCITLLAAATTAAGEARASDVANVPVNERAALSITMPTDGTVRLHPFSAVNLAEEQSVGVLESSIIRRRQKRWQRYQMLVLTAGVVTIACSAVAFVVLQCARKALLPRLFGRMSKRSLSTSYLEDQWLEGCVEVGDGTNQREAVESGVAGEDVLEQDTGESTALKTLNDLKCIVTLGMQTAPYLPSEHSASLVALLFTVCTQELVLYGVYSTPEVELERQRILHFVLQEGQRALAYLESGNEGLNAGRRLGNTIKLLEEFRTPQQEPIPKDLAVEANISAYRIFHCKSALEKLQPWVHNKLPIPEEVSERAVKVVSYTRQSCKVRIKRDVVLAEWVHAVQAKVDFFGLTEGRSPQKSPKGRMPPAELMPILEERYSRLGRGLAKSVNRATGNHTFKHRHQELGKQSEQQHHKDSNAVAETLEQLATVGADVGPSISHSPMPLPAPWQLSLSTQISSLQNHPVLLPIHPSPTESHYNTPITHTERWGRSPAYSSTWRHESQQATNSRELSTFDSLTSGSVLQTEAPAFTPLKYPLQAEMQHHIQPDAGSTWPYIPPSPAALPWRAVDPSADFPRPLPLPGPTPTPRQRQSAYIRTIFPLTATSTGSPTPRNPLPTPQFPSPRPSAEPPRLPQPTEGPSLRFSRPILHSPPSDVPRHGPEPSALFSGSRQTTPRWRFEPPRAFWPPTGGGAQGDVHSPSPHSLVDLNPVMTLVAEAFPSAQSDSDSPTGSGQRQHLDQGWPHVPGSDRP